MRSKRQSLLLVGVVALTMFLTALAPVVLWAIAQPPVSSLTSQFGVLLAQTLPAGHVIDSSTQAFGGPSYWLLPTAGWISSMEVVTWLLQVCFQLAACVVFVELWIRVARPVRPTEFSGERSAIYTRTIAFSLLWLFFVAVCVSQIRIALVSWHNETIGNTWQIYDGTMDVESTQAKATAVSALLLYLLGVSLIARRQVRNVQVSVLALRPIGSCPKCGYAAAGLAKCPECGAAFPESNVPEKLSGPLHAKLLGRWWRVAIAVVVGITVGAGLLAPLAWGVAWTIRQR